jgi:hypothetical protein
MKTVEYVDKGGYVRAAMIRDDDPPEMAAAGIPLEPPDLDDLDWEGIKRDIHNSLVHARLFSWKDVLKKQNAVSGIIARVLKRHVVRLYRFEDQHANEEQTGGDE